MAWQKSFKGSYRKIVEVYYRKPIRLASPQGGVKVIVGVKGTLASETRSFIKIRDISDIVRDEQPDWAERPQAEDLRPAWVYVNKRNIGSLYVKV